MYLSTAVPADVANICNGRPLLSGSEFDALDVVARCQLDSSATTKLGAQGYFVTVYSDSEPINVRATEKLCA